MDHKSYSPKDILTVALEELNVVLLGKEVSVEDTGCAVEALIVVLAEVPVVLVALLDVEDARVDVSIELVFCKVVVLLGVVAAFVVVVSGQRENISN